MRGEQGGVGVGRVLGVSVWRAPAPPRFPAPFFSPLAYPALQLPSHLPSLVSCPHTFYDCLFRPSLFMIHLLNAPLRSPCYAWPVIHIPIPILTVAGVLSACNPAAPLLSSSDARRRSCWLGGAIPRCEWGGRLPERLQQQRGVQWASDRSFIQSPLS